MTKAELKALLALYDSKQTATAPKLGISRHLLGRLCALGFARRIVKRPLTYVGTSQTLYAITERGKQEALLTGKRFVPIVGP